MKQEWRLGEMPNKWQWKPTERSIRLGFTLCVFIVLLITQSLLSSAEMLLAHLGLLDNIQSAGDSLLVIGIALISVPIGTFISYPFLHIPMRPFKKILAAMARLADGHYEERLDLGSGGAQKEMEDAFNTLASELQNTEMLRVDFVNNFSHEFKTPIVSINGFAKLLQRGELTEAQRREYIDIIADESTRLASMAENVLNLTRVENQNILTSIKEFNLSEQLRKCLLLLEKKWTSKDLQLEAEFDEVNVSGDPELLQQVWVNLLDNAIKFSPYAGELAVRISSTQERVQVSIHNHGPQIPQEDLKRLFDKFWQGDTSHASEGTGVGLSVVKKIVELHRGYVEVDSTVEETVFTVHLPI